MIKKSLAHVVLLALTLAASQTSVFAQNDVSSEIESINNVIQEKRDNLDGINQRIDELEKEVNKLQRKANSLETEVAILENRAEKIRLDIEATDLQISATIDELTLLDSKIAQLEDEQAKQRSLLQTALREMYALDQRSGLFLVFGTDSFSDFFEGMMMLGRINGKVSKALNAAKELSEVLQAQRGSKEDKLVSVQKLATQLSDQQDQLVRQQTAKEVLVLQTKESEAEYKALVAELMAEQSYIQNQIVALQSDIDKKLSAIDEGGDGYNNLSWPLDPSVNRITALFHDPTYPFRYLFEHSGLDVAAPVGSAVRSPAPGYVAWTRQGTLYGNYMMVIHSGGIATLYAHLSSFKASADQFVSRGEVIATTGGCKGCAGAGLSTGAHLHFEVRYNGIPTNPLEYVIRP